MQKYLYFLVTVDTSLAQNWLHTWKDSYTLIPSASYNSDPVMVAEAIDNLYDENIRNIVIDDTNLTERRTILIRTIKERFSDIQIKLVFFPKPLRNCTPEEIEKLKSFHGFHEEFLEGLCQFIVAGGCLMTEDVRQIPIAFWAYRINDIRHVDTLGKHLARVLKYLETKGVDANHEVLTAAAYHDIAKVYYNDNCYINHQRISAYIWYCDMNAMGSVFTHYVAALIEQHHSQPRSLENERLHARFFKKSPPEIQYSFTTDLALLQEANNYVPWWQKVLLKFRRRGF